MTETPSIAPIPEGWTRTTRAPITVDGIEWRSYRTHPNTYALLAEHTTKAVIGRNYNKSTFSASVGGKSLGHLFRTEATAMLAASNALKGTT